MKIAVYAISKNEEQFVDTWVASMREADGIYVLDTGSTDATVENFPAVVILDTVGGDYYETARKAYLSSVIK